MLELRLQIVEDILGKLGRQLAKVEKEYKNIFYWA